MARKPTSKAMASIELILKNLKQFTAIKGLDGMECGT
jgi:hypothetical protein